jgi:hypothetical protein
MQRQSAIIASRKLFLREKHGNVLAENLPAFITKTLKNRVLPDRTGLGGDQSAFLLVKETGRGVWRIRRLESRAPCAGAPRSCC